MVGFSNIKMKIGKKQIEGNGLFVTLDELMKMRKYAVYHKENVRKKTFSQQVGDIKSAFKGRGIEMEEIRKYQFGDDVRDIDWRVTARKNNPYTKVYLEEKDREILVWLDLSQTMLFGSVYELKSVTAAKIAALLGWVAINNGDRFGCVIFDGEKSWVFKPKHDRAYLTVILKKIAEVSQYILKTNVNIEEEKVKSLKLIKESVKNKANLFVVTSFWEWEGLYLTELAMLAKLTKVFLINVFDRLEEKAPKQGQYMAEFNGDKIVFDSSVKEYRKKYAKYFEQKRKEKEDFCRKFGCSLTNFNVDMGFVNGLKIY